MSSDDLAERPQPLFMPLLMGAAARSGTAKYARVDVVSAQWRVHRDLLAGLLPNCFVPIVEEPVILSWRCLRTTACRSSWAENSLGFLNSSLTFPLRIAPMPLWFVKHRSGGTRCSPSRQGRWSLASGCLSRPRLRQRCWGCVHFRIRSMEGLLGSRCGRRWRRRFENWRSAERPRFLGGLPDLAISPAWLVCSTPCEPLPWMNRCRWRGP